MKPDQLVKRRGKLGLVKVDTDVCGVREWLSEHMGQELEIEAAKLCCRVQLGSKVQHVHHTPCDH